VNSDTKQKRRKTFTQKYLERQALGNERRANSGKGRTARTKRGRDKKLISTAPMAKTRMTPKHSVKQERTGLDKSGKGRREVHALNKPKLKASQLLDHHVAQKKSSTTKALECDVRQRTSGNTTHARTIPLEIPNTEGPKKRICAGDEGVHYVKG